MSGPTFRTQMFLQVLKRARFGTIDLQLPDGRRESYGEGEPLIRVVVQEWSAIDQLFNRGDLGLAETIIDGTIIVDNAAKLVEWACRNDQELARTLHGSWYGTLLSRIKHLMNRNDRGGARRNIIAHYDLGNEFYRLWLDPTMSYSSAIFQSPGQDLQDAQNAKYDRIIDSLGIRSGDHVLEIGCGWGGFFSRAVERTGCKVTAVMNSPEQARHNRSLIEQVGMTGHVDLRQQDYRDIQGKFDKVVSIEMIEAVGEKYWSQYFGKVNASLNSGGSALIQGITIRDDLFYSYRKSTDFIQQYVFPGGMLLSNEVFRGQAKNHGMDVTDIFEFGQDYADTLKKWRENFNAAETHVRAMGFDDKFIRLWNLYLSYCEGAFRAGRISVGQFHLAA